MERRACPGKQGVSLGHGPVRSAVERHNGQGALVRRVCGHKQRGGGGGRDSVVEKGHALQSSGKGRQRRQTRCDGFELAVDADNGASSGVERRGGWQRHGHQRRRGANGLELGQQGERSASRDGREVLQLLRDIVGPSQRGGEAAQL